jgi:murein tripeptide amidase MpaA
MRLLLLSMLIVSSLGLHDSVIESVETFTGFQVFRVSPQDKVEAAFLQTLRINSHYYDFWTEVRVGAPVDIMVPPGMASQLSQDLAGIRHSLHIEDVQHLIETEKIPARPEKWQMNKMAPRHAMTWTEYHTLEDMYTYLDFLEEEFDFVTTEEIGQSGEGRAMRVVSVCRDGCGNKSAVWIDGGIHAREWVSPATVTWMLKELVENDAAHPDLLDNMDWFFLPSANPDGYAYSRDHNRMWRKTRSNNGGILGCKGVDANRNWGYHWNEGGSSNDRCQDTYHGPEAWSEPENVHVSDFILARKDQIVFYNSIHSYSQLILLPWGFQQQTPDDYDQMLALAEKGSDALTAVHGKVYEAGCIPCMLYIASGSSTDWAHGIGIEFTTSMELRDTGHDGFLLPADQIIPTAEETWAFHITVIRELAAARD